MGQPFLMIDFPPGDHPQGAFFLMEVDMADCLQYMPFYTRDWIASTASFTLAQKGAYVTLLAVAWTEGGVPNSYEACSRIAGGITEDDWAVIRKRLVVLDAGTSDERLSHARLERERKLAAGKYEAKVRAVAKARESRKAKTVDSSVPNSVVNIDNNTDNSIDNNTVVIIENNAQPEPKPKPKPKPDSLKRNYESPNGDSTSDSAKPRPSRTYRICWTEGNGFSGITEEDRARWGDAYPGVNIDSELKRIHAWLADNPSKAGKRNYASFIGRWLARVQDRGGSKVAVASRRNCL